jgi:hypothetical protein
LERYNWFQVLVFPKCCSEFFEGKSDDLVVQVQFVSMVKTDRLEGNSSGADLKKSCSGLGCLGWANVRRAWDDLLGRVLWWNYADLDAVMEVACGSCLTLR